MSELIKVKKEKDTVTLTLNRPEKRNALNQALTESLLQVMNEIASDSCIKLVFLESVGRSFCAGADLNWMATAAHSPDKENFDHARLLANLLYQLDQLPQLTIALVHGAAYGGGVGLFTCCDLTIAVEDAVFCFSEIKLGLSPDVIAPYIINRIGSHARRYFLTAEPFDAKTALHIGLIQELVADSHELLNLKNYFISQITDLDKEAMGATKSMIHQINGGLSQEKRIEVTAKRLAHRRKHAKQRLMVFL